MNSADNNVQSLVNQYDSDFRVISFALLISIVMHFSFMRALPWLETVKAIPPLDIIAELQILAPPQPPSVASKPVEQPSEPEITKVNNQPKQIFKTQALPVLTSKQAEPTSTYTAPEVPQLTKMSNEPSAPVEPEPTSAQSESVAVASENTSTTFSSTSTWDDSDVWDEYGSNLQRLCERNKRYPEIARRRGWQGLVKVMARFSTEGKVLGIMIQTSSGQNTLDEQALEMVRKSINELPLPSKFKGREFKITIPVDFKLE